MTTLDNVVGRAYEYDAKKRKKQQLARALIASGLRTDLARDDIKYPGVMWYQLEFETTNLDADVRLIDTNSLERGLAVVERPSVKTIILSDKVGEIIRPENTEIEHPSNRGVFFDFKFKQTGESTWSYSKIILNVHYKGLGSFRKIMIVNQASGNDDSPETPLDIRFHFPPPRGWTNF